jgi:hypothetical protein
MKLPFSVYDFFAYLSAGFILLCAADYAFDAHWLLTEKLAPGQALLLTIVSYIAGHLIANVSSFLIEHKLVRGLLGAPEELLFQNHQIGRWSKLFPVYFKPFPPETQRRVLDKASANGITAPGRGLFFHCFAIVKRSKSTLERLNAFLSLYGFCRNVSVACLLAAGVLLFGAVFHSGGARPEKLGLAFLAAVGSIGLLYRYLKFFKHYTEEVFRTYAELPAHRGSKPDPK